jgi:hypothetical protein
VASWLRIAAPGRSTSFSARETGELSTVNDLYFNYATVTGRSTWPHVVKALREEASPVLESLGAHAYGMFAPQFGLASKQLVWITRWDRVEDAASAVERTLLALDAVERVDQQMIAPTARPKTGEPPQRAGVYVHRWFELASANVAEVVELSAVAWETFEEAFEVEVVGFFETLDDRKDAAQLMLLNWYPTLAAWEASRNFEADPESRKRFVRRAELTTGTRAISTTLVPPSAG